MHLGKYVTWQFSVFKVPEKRKTRLHSTVKFQGENTSQREGKGKINLQERNGKRRCGEKKKELLLIQSITAFSVKHGGGIFMAWASTAGTGTGSIVFTGDSVDLIQI